MRTLFLPFARIIDILFPQICSGCGRGRTLLCADCLAAAPSARESTHEFITAVFDYKNPTIRSVIWKLKYKNARGVAGYFGEKIYEEILGGIADGLHISKNETFLLVPIPLHKKRLRERGYNQSELLAREILKYDNEKIFHLETKVLIRERETNAQARKEKREARFENLRGAFHADPVLVKNKNIILVDDVTTTGATLTEARKALMKAGARTVKAYAVAH